jgi:3-hydroxyisobutyrate dehydrogenase-like beta-hydroxyacid dehydrogenase
LSVLRGTGGFCNYIQIFVSDDDALLQTVEQLSEKLTPRHVIFAHSTVAPDSMRAAADIVERRGARFVEACFTGSKAQLKKASLFTTLAEQMKRCVKAVQSLRPAARRSAYRTSWPGQRY